MNSYFVYILTNWDQKVMYVGITNNLEKRLHEHRLKVVPGFTRRYNVDRLVYYELFGDINAAIAREKEIKNWRRGKKNALVSKENPEWKDLSNGWYEDPSSLRFSG